MKKQLFILVSLLVCFVVFSANVYAACSSNQCYGKIERLYVNNTALFISTDGDENALDCTAPGGVYVSISLNHPNFKNLYAMMLTSMSLDNSIGLRIVNGSSDCSLAYTYMDN
jgi:hypothetical protein